MAETLTDVANAALLSIGEEPIENIDDKDSDSARVLRLRIYDVVRNVQSNFTWPELYHFEPLVDSGTFARDGVTPRYNLPTYCLQIINVLPASSEPEGFGITSGTWRREGQFIATQETEPVLECLKYNVDNVAAWSEQLLKRAWTALAAEVAPLLTKNNKLIELALRNAEIAKRTEQGRSAMTKQSTLRRGRGQNWCTERRQRYDNSTGAQLPREAI